ncbi:MAG: SDR family oxidoreductase [bacterium]
MKILVLGAGGMAGHTVSLYFIEKGHAVTTFSRTPLNFGKNIVGDATDKNFFKNLLISDDFNVVINCIGLLIKECEIFPEKAVYLNSYLPHLAASVLKERKAKFIHISTDCVFAGNTGPYYEDSLPDGKLFYDRTKALGEINDSKNLTFRNSIIGPDIKEKGVGLFNWFMKQSGEINGFTKAIWTGVTTLTLAKAMERAIETDFTGLKNLVNNDNISKFELLSLFNKHFSGGKIKINKYETFSVDKTLLTNRGDFDFVVPSYEEMILEMKEWIYSHKDIYTHYFKRIINEKT